MSPKTTRKEAHVIPSSEGWDVVVEPGAAARDSTYPTQEAAETRARQLLKQNGGGEVVIHGRDGRIKESNSVEPSSPAQRAR